tara:strand:+ start:365 stop:580 length:216 start_codon:yes stop_codon:yes gene_type:complete
VPKLIIAFILVAIIFAINSTSETQDQVKFCDKYVLIADQMNKTYSISNYMKENGVEGVLETNHCKNKQGRI